MAPAMKPLFRGSDRKNGRSPGVAEDGIVVTDLSFKPIAFDRGAFAILSDPSQYPGVSEASFHLPPELVDAFRQFDFADLACLRTHFRRGRTRYSCRAYLIQPSNGLLPQPLVAVLFQKDPCVDDAIQEVSASYGLTDRQQEVLRGIAIGLTSKELAARMDISPNTVKAFLRMIMTKMGVTTRAGLVGKLLNHNEDRNY